MKHSNAKTGLVLVALLASTWLAKGVESNPGWFDTGLGNLALLSDAKTRSIGPENPTGEKGKGGMAKLGEGSASHAAGDLGQGWKVNLLLQLPSGLPFYCLYCRLIQKRQLCPFYRLVSGKGIIGSLKARRITLLEMMKHIDR